MIEPIETVILSQKMEDQSGGEMFDDEGLSRVLLAFQLRDNDRSDTFHHRVPDLEDVPEFDWRATANSDLLARPVDEGGRDSQPQGRGGIAVP